MKKRNKTGGVKDIGKQMKMKMTILGIASVLIAVYMGSAFFYSSHYYFGTTINGINSSMKTVAKLEDSIAKSAEKYVLNISARENLKDSINAEEIALKAIFDDSFVRILKEQNPFLWVTAFFKEHKYEVNTLTTYDEKALKEKTQQLVFFESGMERVPTDALISEYSPDTNVYSIIKEDMGTTIDKSRTFQTIEKAVENLIPELSLEESNCYINPKVMADDGKLVMVLNQLNKYVNMNVTYELGEEREVLDGSIIHEWLSVTDDEILIDAEKVREYVNNLARTYDTFGKPKVFRNSYGEVMTIKEGGYGWWTDKAAETEELIKLLKASDMLSEPIVREPIYRARGARRGVDDIGSTYVEIDLTKQHLFMYKDGVRILESDFVSGNVSKGYDTPIGVFALTYKQRDAVLRGEDYETPVKYWMPFNGNVGMHDASWRTTFGGDLFVKNGSHGCVNMPPAKAQQMYEHVEKGMPVIVYGGYVPPVPTPEELFQKQLEELMAAQAALLNEELAKQGQLLPMVPEQPSVE